MTAALELRQLTAPDPVGRDLALYRTRAYRFTDDLRHAVLAEVLEERHILGQALGLEVISYVRTCLDGVRATGRFPAFDGTISRAAQIDLPAELAARCQHAAAPAISPEMVVAIVGAPRSGTSHLFNLLAVRTGFAYFTTVTCWAWPTYNLDRPGRRLFSQLTPSEREAVLSVDNKSTRLIPSLVMPYEAEDVYARAVPVYRHLNRHHYDLRIRAQAGDQSVLSRAVSEHLRHFDTDRFLTKSPFNSLRIPQLDRLWEGRTRYLHIVRHQAETADSMRRNRFEFSQAGRKLSGEEAWSVFTDTVVRDLPPGRGFTVRHEDLLADPEASVESVLGWLRLSDGRSST
jgi:sulfotransferase family protein